MRRKNDIISQGPSKEEQKIIAWLRKEPVPEVPQEEVQTVCRTATSYYTRPQGAGDAGFWLAALSCRWRRVEERSLKATCGGKRPGQGFGSRLRASLSRQTPSLLPATLRSLRYLWGGLFRGAPSPLL